MHLMLVKIFLFAASNKFLMDALGSVISLISSCSDMLFAVCLLTLPWDLELELHPPEYPI
jgi:hypothetical protein